MAAHLEDRYLRVGRPRPFRELSASAVARERGIRTPAVVVGATYSDGLYYRCDLITEVVSEARTLADILREGDDTRSRSIALARAGALVRQLAAAGVYHVDLNARNILLEEANHEPAWVIDLDRSRILPGSSPSACDRMRARLIRSIVKVVPRLGGRPKDQELIEAALQARPEEL